MFLCRTCLIFCLLLGAAPWALSQDAAPPAADKPAAAAAPAAEPAAATPAATPAAQPAATPAAQPAAASPAPAPAAAAKDDGGSPPLTRAPQAWLRKDLPLQNYSGGPIDLILLLKKIKRANPRELAHVSISETLRGRVDVTLESSTFNRLLTWLVDQKRVTVDVDSETHDLFVLPYQPAPPGPSATPYFVPDIPLGDIITEQVDLVAQLRTWALDQDKRLVVDPALRGRTVASLVQPNMTINRFLDMLEALEVASAQRVGSFVFVQLPGARTLWPNRILYQPDRDQVEFDLAGIPVADFVAEVRQSTGKTVLLDEGLPRESMISGHIEMLPFALALQTLFENAGYGFRLNQPDPKQPEAVYFLTVGTRRQGVHHHDAFFDVYFENAPLNTVFQELSKVTHVPLVLTDKLDKVVSVDLKNMPEQALLDLLLVGTGYRFVEGERAYVLQKIETMTELVPFTKIRADTVAKMLPDSLKAGMTVAALPAINSILLSGPPQNLQVLREFVAQLDRSVPQVLLEVTMVDFTDSNKNDLNFSLKAGGFTLLGADGNSTGSAVDVQVNAAPNQDGNIQIGRLPSNYTFNFNALETKGLGKVIQKPLIAAMSGEEAEIKIGTTVYFMLTSEEIVGTDNPRVRTTERIESEEANFSLKIRPYVISPDLLTVEVEPNFDSFSGSVTNNTPPPKSVTSLKSTVHLRNGETIVLGGLIKNTMSMNNRGVPFISRIPVLGNLFKSHNYDKDYNETYIYIRPTIYYGEPDSVAYIRDPKRLDPDITKKEADKKDN